MLVCLLFIPLASQEIEHAPTVEQCRADAALWDNQLDEYNQAARSLIEGGGKLEVPPNTDIGRLSFIQLNARIEEIVNCHAVDGKDADLHRLYYRVTNGLSSARDARFKDFVFRHGYYKQFLAEDQKGLR